DSERLMSQGRANGKSRNLYRSAVSRNDSIMPVRNTARHIASRLRQPLPVVCRGVIVHGAAQHECVKQQQHDQPERNEGGAGNAARQQRYEPGGGTKADLVVVEAAI